MNANIENNKSHINYPSIKEITEQTSNKITSKYIDTFFSYKFKQNYFNLKNIHNEFK